MAIQSNLEWGDYLSLVGYFVIVIGFGIWSSMKKKEKLVDYLLPTSMHFIPVGASLFASNIGSEHFIGLAGSGSSVGIGSAGFEINALYTLIFLGWVFYPVYFKAGVLTMPEYIKKRFGGDRIRIYLSVLSLLLYVFTKISANLFSGALFIQQSIDINTYLAIIILLLISAFFTIGGGLTAVIWTDFIQTVILLIGAFFLMITCFVKVGGYEEMITLWGYAVPNTTLYSNSTAGLPAKDYLNLARSVDSPDYPWPGMLIGALISSTWYWCTDQVIVQRVLAAKNRDHARAGCILAGLLKFLPMFLLIYPGMVSRILYPDEVACADEAICNNVCNSPNGCTNVAYAKMVIDLMPVGARGLMLAVMMAALMSSLTSIFNSSSTLFTIDIYQRIRTNAREWELMVVSRLFVVVLVGISILWIPIIQNNPNSRLFDYIQSVTSFLSPPICAVFLNAVFFERINEQGAFWSLMIGLVIGMTRFIMESVNPDLPIVKEVHFLHFGILLFGITTICLWAISLMTPPIPSKCLRGLTYFTINSKEKAIQIPSSKGFGARGFCAGADLSKVDEDEQEMKVKGAVNEAYEDNTVVVNEPKEKEIPSVDAVEQKLPFWKRAFYFVCGIENLAKQDDDTPQVIERNTEMKSNPTWARIINIVAICVAAGAGFFIAFFNKYN